MCLPHLYNALKILLLGLSRDEIVTVLRRLSKIKQILLQEKA